MRCQVTSSMFNREWVALEDAKVPKIVSPFDEKKFSTKGMDSDALGGKRYFVKEKKVGEKASYEVWDNEKGKPVKVTSDQEEALNYCYYKNWEYQRKVSDSGGTAKDKIKALGWGVVALAVPMLAKEAVVWFIQRTKNQVGMGKGSFGGDL